MKVAYHPNFIKQFKKLSSVLQIEVKEKIEIFEENYLHHSLKTHKLHGRFKKDYAFSVNYSYRIIFRIFKDEALFLEIGTHDMYR
ncbi:MAG: Bacterial toxin of type toxin-antitoxin system, YafQ [Candidatus Parcubacteria bacterium]|jgi:addiction module RelE/StbE family toxin